MTKPKVLVLTGYGINCEEETAFVFNKVGGQSAICHVNDLIEAPSKLNEYQILALPGGFSYGDDTGSGNALANRLRNKLNDAIQEFINRDSLILGTCNGCQVAANLGIIPGFDDNYENRLIAFTHNASARYEDRWVHLKVEKTNCIFTRDLDSLYVPIAHGEGNFTTAPEVLKKLEQNNQVVVRYAKPDGALAQQQFPHNPNGSINDIAGLCDPTGRIFGLMPHPERAIFFTNRPDWPLLKEQLKRQGKEIPDFAEPLKIFENAVSYFN
ncbi:MAG: phosphoribosylformylglycinamidine synthase I [bacterium]